MALRNIGEKSTVTCGKDESVVEIACRMKEADVGSIVVVEDSQPVGMITDRDLVIRALAGSKAASALTAEEVMTRPVHCIHQDATVLDAVEMMHDRVVRRLVVINDEGAPTAVISAGDVAELLAHEFTQLASLSGSHNEKLFRRAREDAA